MPKYTIDGTTLSDVADAVRELDGDSSAMTPAQMATRIRAVQPGGVDLSVIADDYDTTATYDVGDYCIHDSGLYVCTTAISTAEAWTAGHWEEVTVGDELSDLKSDLSELPKEAGGSFTARRLIPVEENGLYIVDDNKYIGYEIDDIDTFLRNSNGKMKMPVYFVNGVAPDSNGHVLLDSSSVEAIKVNESGFIFVDSNLNIGYVLNVEALNYTNEAYSEFKKKHTLNGTWCSIGTSITWYNDHPVSNMKRGYQSRVMDVIDVDELYNVGWNGGTIQQLTTDLARIVEADFYTIEHGVNDWGRTPVGVRSDYVNSTGSGTFYGCYRLVIDKIYQLNPDAKIILCTPRKAYGFNDYLPATSESPKNGIYLHEYASAVKEIAEIESLLVCDWFGSIGVNDRNLRQYSIDDALHPNDAGMQVMADKLVETIKILL